MVTVSTMVNADSGADLSKDIRYMPLVRAQGAARALGAALNLLSLVAPQRAAALVNDLVWCRPRRLPPKPEESSALAQAERIDVHMDGEPLSAYAWGQGPVVLMVHGWSGSAAQMGPLARRLAAQGYRAVAYDAPAHGASPAKQTDFPAMTQALRAVAERSGRVRAVVAHSAGCVPLLRSLRAGLAVERIVMISVFAQLALPLASLGAALGLRPRLQALHIDSLRQRFGTDFREAYSPEELVRDLNVPGLLVHDTADKEFGAANAELIASKWPGSDLFLTDGLGHYRVLKDEAVALRIGASLSDLLRQP
jgi:pimeloyl-ACP methyl ester carboxylesterase